MTYDLIVLTLSKNDSIRRMTQHCINTCVADAEVHGHRVNVIVVESGEPTVYDKVDTFVNYEGFFNYNRALNEGLKHRIGDIQIMANNDLVFCEGWSKVGPTMKASGYLSASLLDSRIHRFFKINNMAYEGYTIGMQFTGWCLFADSKVWDIIGDLDETHHFWFSDNMYAKQLEDAGIAHALMAIGYVEHLGSVTHKTMDKATQRKYVTDEIAKYRANAKI